MTKKVPPKNGGAPVKTFGEAKANVKGLSERNSGGALAYKGSRSAYAKGFSKGGKDA